MGCFGCEYLIEFKGDFGSAGFALLGELPLLKPFESPLPLPYHQTTEVEMWHPGAPWRRREAQSNTGPERALFDKAAGFGQRSLRRCPNGVSQLCWRINPVAATAAKVELRSDRC